ncbi:phage repressor protein [halophilic archaeon]|nr:phage repressor protein [halophilic archaeon]
MVQRVSWFAKIDYLLFGFFENHDIRVTPKVVADNIGYGRNYTGKRLRALRDAGLLVQHENGAYELSDLGREFLAGDLTREEVEALDPDKDDANDDE